LIQIFPNPVRNQLEIRLEQTTNFRLNRLQIVDALGRVKALVEQPRQAFSINTTQWLAGTYYLRLIRNDREVLVRPIVKL
jgi:DNA-binding transcriptional regulator PaaX